MPTTPGPTDKSERSNEFSRGVSRRSFIQTIGASAAGASIAGSVQAMERERETHRAPDGPPVIGPGAVDMTLEVNGQKKTFKAEPCTTLLEALRYHLALTGSKEICDRGSCGGCSVIVDGKLVNSCLMLAADAVGAKITTVEGLGQGGKLHPVQESFIRHDALQCGYCTPGFVVASAWLLQNTPKPSLDQIKSALAGNICRCGTYTNVFNAVLDASGQAPIADSPRV